MTALDAFAYAVTAALVLIPLASLAWLAWAVLTAPVMDLDPIDQAFRTLPAGHRELHIDTTTGSHDALPIRDDIRQMLTDYVEGMWRHTQEMP